jgi:ubiquinone/menaquinone biosynthesis C-methylase UbiE
MSKIFTKWYDTMMSPLEKRQFKSKRINLLKKAEGQVLELGSGTGINFPLYESADHVTAIEPSKHMIEQSISKSKISVVPIKIIHGSAEQLPFEDKTFDTVVGTLVFCTIPNPERAIKEMIRVCKPGGKILLFEHVKMENSHLAHLQDWLTPFWKKICDGCCLNRDTLKLLSSHDIQISQIKKYYKGLFILVEAKNA